MSIIWPWAARKAIEAYKSEADYALAMNARLELKLKEAELRNRIHKTHIERLTDLLNDAHFRNPKTGRIGKKGQRFK
jgi:hypothetical protein